jgi:DNA polymerase-3 subunit delta'
MPFRHITGHRTLVTLLSRSIARESLPPSLIFSGPAGVGKRLAAVATAQALNCLAPVRPDTTSDAEGLPLDACGTCAACTRIARGVHPDVLILEPNDKGNIRIEPVRDLLDRAGYRPFEGRRRVSIIDDADALEIAAQNALLKVLEEPPSGSVFILVTSMADQLLPTVRSRCPQLRFRPLASSEVAAALVQKGHAKEQALAVAALAEGSIRRALEASADEVIEARDVAVRVLNQAAQSDDVRRRAEAAKELLPKSSGASVTDRDQVAVHLRAMASILRDVQVMATGADRAAIANQDLLQPLERLTAFAGERGRDAFQAIDRALAAIERNANAKIVADWLVLQL